VNASFNSSNSLHGNDGDIAHHAILSSNPFGSSLSLPQTSQAYTPALTCQTILPDVQDGTSYFGARQSADDTDGGGRGAASGNQTMWDNRLARKSSPMSLFIFTASHGFTDKQLSLRPLHWTTTTP
jgi:hypothetical protein